MVLEWIDKYIKRTLNQQSTISQGNRNQVQLPAKNAIFLQISTQLGTPFRIEGSKIVSEIEGSKNLRSTESPTNIQTQGPLQRQTEPQRLKICDELWCTTWDDFLLKHCNWVFLRGVSLRTCFFWGSCPSATVSKKSVLKLWAAKDPTTRVGVYTQIHFFDSFSNLLSLFTVVFSEFLCLLSFSYIHSKLWLNFWHQPSSTLPTLLRVQRLPRRFKGLCSLVSGHALCLQNLHEVGFFEMCWNVGKFKDMFCHINIYQLQLVPLILSPSTVFRSTNLEKTTNVYCRSRNSGY